MQAVVMCVVVAVLAGATGPRDPAVKPAVQNPSRAVADEKPARQDRRADEKPVCTLIVVPAEPRLDAGFARPAEKVDPGMVVRSRCR